MTNLEEIIKKSKANNGQFGLLVDCIEEAIKEEFPIFIHNETVKLMQKHSLSYGEAMIIVMNAIKKSFEDR